jgi:hypothetical protein
VVDALRLDLLHALPRLRPFSWVDPRAMSGKVETGFPSDIAENERSWSMIRFD